MNPLIQKIKNPNMRRKLLVISSGGLILVALILGQFFSMLSLKNALMIAAALIAGSEIAVRAFVSLRNKHISIELLVTIATIGALVIGEYWEAAAVTFLFILGAYLEARTLSQTRSVLKGLLDLTPTTAIVIRSGSQVEISPFEVNTGEIVIIKPGGKIAVDGEVIEGHSTVEESTITGESMPEDKVVGSKVFAGTVNLDGLLKVKAVGVGADTTLVRIIKRVEEAQDEKAPTQRFIENFAKWYTPFIIALSFVAYLISGDVELALTLLVIGCPGALVISTPVSVVAGIGRAAKSGILIKGGEYLENAGKISVLAMDKTGTLTQGKPRVTDVIELQPENAALAVSSYGISPVGSTDMDSLGWSIGQQQILRWAAAVEAGSEHPLSRAILSAAKFLGEVPQVYDFDTYTGRGVRGFINGAEIGVGTEALMQELEVSIPEAAKEYLVNLKSSGKTAVMVSYDSEVIGIIGIADTPRENAAEMIRRLESMRLKRVIMLTGDDELTARAIAQEIGVTDIKSRLLPENKLQVVRDLQKEGQVVAMVGDGINDAPTLAAADIGIAMGAAGTDIAIETADIVLMSDDLMKIPEALQYSKLTVKNIQQNVIIALFTVILLLLGVLFGKVHMAGGMLIHEASVLIVILNGMRLMRLSL